MKNHAAFGLGITDLDVVVVDDSKPMQTLLRSILLSFRVRRVRVFDSPELALESMLVEPPNLILTDWRMKPMSGYQLLRMIRHRHMDPLCYVPLLFITAHGTRPLVDKAMRAGAHHLLVKPVAPSMINKRLLWITRDDRPLVLENTGFYNIDGVHAHMDRQAEKMRNLDNARQQHETAIRRYAAVQGMVDKEFSTKNKGVAGAQKVAAVSGNEPHAAGSGKKARSAGSRSFANVLH